MTSKMLQYFESYHSTLIYHRKQTREDDCSRTCLLMLCSPLAAQPDTTHIPCVIETFEMPLYAASVGLYLAPLPITQTTIVEGTYLILRNAHWFILRVYSDMVVFHDPLSDFHKTHPIEVFQRMPWTTGLTVILSVTPTGPSITGNSTPTTSDSLQ